MHDPLRDPLTGSRDLAPEIQGQWSRVSTNHPSSSSPSRSIAENPLHLPLPLPRLTVHPAACTLVSMKIRTADLYDQAFTPSQIPNPTYPQVAVFGRSNVGKSSLLATLMGRKKLVKVSSRPGKTRAIFYYLVNNQILLVDLPGYGFSRAPKSMASQWQKLVEAYLDTGPGPSLALHLIDIRHPPTREDVTVHAIIQDRGIPDITVATKADKLSRSARLRSLEVISRDLKEPRDRIIPASAKDVRIPINDLWARIIDEIGERSRTASSS